MGSLLDGHRRFILMLRNTKEAPARGQSAGKTRLGRKAIRAKRISDCAFAILLLPLLTIPFLLIAILVKFTSRGPVLYWSDRVGRNNTIFRMPKFRTMKMNTPEVATHLL